MGTKELDWWTRTKKGCNRRVKPLKASPEGGCQWGLFSQWASLMTHELVIEPQRKQVRLLRPPYFDNRFFRKGENRVRQPWKHHKVGKTRVFFPVSWRGAFVVVCGSDLFLSDLSSDCQRAIYHRGDVHVTRPHSNSLKKTQKTKIVKCLILSVRSKMAWQCCVKKNGAKMDANRQHGGCC